MLLFFGTAERQYEGGVLLLILLLLCTSAHDRLRRSLLIRLRMRLLLILLLFFNKKRKPVKVRQFKVVNSTRIDEFGKRGDLSRAGRTNSAIARARDATA